MFFNKSKQSADTGNTNNKGSQKGTIRSFFSGMGGIAKKVIKIAAISAGTQYAVAGVIALASEMGKSHGIHNAVVSVKSIFDRDKASEIDYLNDFRSSTGQGISDVTIPDNQTVNVSDVSDNVARVGVENNSAAATIDPNADINKSSQGVTVDAQSNNFTSDDLAMVLD